MTFAQEAATRAIRTGYSTAAHSNDTMSNEAGVASSSSGKGGKRKSPAKSKSKDVIASVTPGVSTDSIDSDTMSLSEEQMVGFIESLCHAFPIPPSIFGVTS